jgi:predicted nucleic acid-binding protein
VPEAVWGEIANSPSVDKAVQMIPTADWLNKISVNPVPEIVRWDLGNGETEVLGYAFLHQNYTPILDDSAAKKCAISLGLRTIGTGSMLILAKEEGLIDSVEKSLIKLRNSGMWISDHVIKLLKEKVGE